MTSLINCSWLATQHNPVAGRNVCFQELLGHVDLNLHEECFHIRKIRDKSLELVVQASQNCIPFLHFSNRGVGKCLFLVAILDTVPIITLWAPDAILALVMASLGIWFGLRLRLILAILNTIPVITL